MDNNSTMYHTTKLWNIQERIILFLIEWYRFDSSILSLTAKIN